MAALSFSDACVAWCLKYNQDPDSSKSLKLKGFFWSDDINILVSILKNTHYHIKSLSLHGSEMTEKAVKILVEGLNHCVTLEHLDLSGVGMNDQSMIAIANALENNTSIMELDVRGNWIGSSGGEAIAKLIRANTTLTSIYMSGNGVGDKGMTAISEALETNTTLKTLLAETNRFGEKGGLAVAKMLGKNTTLENLSIDHNHIGPIAGTELIHQIKEKNYTLLELTVSNTNTGHYIMFDIKEEIEKNKNYGKTKFMYKFEVGIMKKISQTNWKLY